MVFLLIVFLILLFIIGFVFSNIEVEISHLKFHSKTKRHLNKDYEIIIKLSMFCFLPIFKIRINKARLEKIKIKEKIKKIDFKFLENNQKLDKNVLEAIKQLNISIQKINLQIEIGTENASLTSILVPAISTILAIILQKKIKKFENQIFMVHPIYQNQNLVNLYLSGIFEIKMSHIINSLYILTKKEKRGVKKNERTSHRRSYDYSYE